MLVPPVIKQLPQLGQRGVAYYHVLHGMIERVGVLLWWVGGIVFFEVCQKSSLEVKNASMFKIFALAQDLTP